MLMPGTLTINSSPDFRYVNSFDTCSSVPSFNAFKALSPVNTFFVILSLLINNIIGLAGQHIARSNARTDRYFVFLVPTLLPAGEALLPRLLNDSTVFLLKPFYLPFFMNHLYLESNKVFMCYFFLFYLISARPSQCHILAFICVCFGTIELWFVFVYDERFINISIYWVGTYEVRIVVKMVSNVLALMAPLVL